MSIEQVQNITINEAMKALADYRAAAGITPVKRQAAESAALQNVSSPEPAIEPAISQPRIGRYVNIMA